MSNPTQTWTVTPEQYSAMLAGVNAAGFALSGNSGTTSKEGVTFGWNYDGTTLSITVEKTSWYDPSVASIDTQIAAAINKALA